MSTSLSLYCRLCAEQKLAHELIDLSSNIKFREEIVNKLTIYGSRLIDFSIKTLPETICMQCIQMLNSAFDFCNKIKLSQVNLTYLISSILKTSEDSNNSLDCTSEVEMPKTEVNDSTEFKIEFDGYNITLYENHKEKESISWSTYPWVCSHCDAQVESLGALRRHSNKCHNVCFSMKCADCKDDIFIDDFEEFVAHVRRHRKELNHCCQHCNMTLQPETMDDHITTHKIQPHCHVCGEFFADDFMLHGHLMLYQKHNEYNMSWTEYDWVCKECNVKLKDQGSLRRHAKEVHGKCFSMQCADCPETVDSFNAFVDHVREHKPSLKYYCQYCNFKFKDANQTIIHLTEHLFYQCEVCGESFTSPSALSSHVDAYSGKKKKRKQALTKQDLTCNICQKITKSLNNLKTHMMVHTDRQRNHTCDRCGKAFFTKGALKSHNVLHEMPQPEICEICKKTFLTRTRLKKHVRTHYSEKNFHCDVCQKSFKLKDQLKGHMVCHSDVMPYACQFCEKTFRFRSVYTTHQRQHTGVRPYVCSVCSMAFGNWSNCNKHMLRRHGATLARTVLTPQGKVPINPKTGKPKKFQDPELVKDWTERILAPKRARNK